MTSLGVSKDQILTYYPINPPGREKFIEDAKKAAKKYQKEKGCREPIQKCRSLDCYGENSKCAAEKIKLEVDAICRVIDDYIKL